VSPIEVEKIFSLRCSKSVRQIQRTINHSEKSRLDFFILEVIQYSAGETQLVAKKTPK
jgi:hypothetical protein